MAAAGVLKAQADATMRGLAVEVREAAIRAQDAAQEAVMAETRDGVAGALMSAQAELELAQQMITAALALHRGVRQ